MNKPTQEKAREERIAMEIVVDAHGPEEQAMGWYYYLQDTLQFPFTAVCSLQRVISPLHVQDEVEVIGMAPEDECEKEVTVQPKIPNTKAFGLSCPIKLSWARMPKMNISSDWKKKSLN